MTVKEFVRKHAFACIFGGIVLSACVFQYRYRKRIPRDSTILSDNSKSKRSSPRKLPERLKTKTKFISSDNDPDQDESHINDKYESTRESKNILRESREKKKEKKE